MEFILKLFLVPRDSYNLLPPTYPFLSFQMVYGRVFLAKVVIYLPNPLFPTSLELASFASFPIVD